MIQSLWTKVCRFLKKLGIIPPYDPTIQLLGICPEETIIEKDTYTLTFNTILFIIANIWKQPRCPSTDEGIKNLQFIYTMEYYSVIKGTYMTQSNKVDEPRVYYIE